MDHIDDVYDSATKPLEVCIGLILAAACCHADFLLVAGPAMVA